MSQRMRLRRDREAAIEREASPQVPLPSTQAGNGVPPIVHEVLQSEGQPLDTGVRESMEARFGHDFSRVRVHTDAKAAESAQAVNSVAYTVGRDVAFAVGHYQPQTTMGQHLLAHELTHVIQQHQAVKSAGAVGTLGISHPRDASEHEAVSTANRAMAGRPVHTPTVVSGTLQRQVASNRPTRYRQGGFTLLALPPGQPGAPPRPHVEFIAPPPLRSPYRDGNLTVIESPQGVVFQVTANPGQGLRIVTPSALRRSFAYQILPGPGGNYMLGIDRLVRIVKTPAIGVVMFGVAHQGRGLPFNWEIYEVPRVEDVPVQGQPLSPVGQWITTIPADAYYTPEQQLTIGAMVTVGVIGAGLLMYAGIPAGVTAVGAAAPVLVGEAQLIRYIGQRALRWAMQNPVQAEATALFAAGQTMNIAESVHQSGGVAAGITNYLASLATPQGQTQLLTNIILHYPMVTGGRMQPVEVPIEVEQAQPGSTTIRTRAAGRLPIRVEANEEPVVGVGAGSNANLGRESGQLRVRSGSAGSIGSIPSLTNRQATAPVNPLAEPEAPATTGPGAGAARTATGNTRPAPVEPEAQGTTGARAATQAGAAQASAPSGAARAAAQAARRAWLRELGQRTRGRFAAAGVATVFSEDALPEPIAGEGSRRRPAVTASVPATRGNTGGGARAGGVTPSANQREPHQPPYTVIQNPSSQVGSLRLPTTGVTSGAVTSGMPPTTPPRLPAPQFTGPPTGHGTQAQAGAVQRPSPTEPTTRAVTGGSRVVGGESHAQGLTEPQVALLNNVESRPEYRQLILGHHNAVRDFLHEFGTWKLLMGRLQTGDAMQRRLGQHILDYRAYIVRELGRLFNAAPVPGASELWISDVDMNVPGDDAGARLVNAEAWMRQNVGENWAEALRMSFFTEAGRLTRYADVINELPPQAQQEMRARLSRATELHTLARMLHYSQPHGAEGHAGSMGSLPENHPIIALARSLGVEAHTIGEMRRLAMESQPRREARRGELLREIDLLQSQFRQARTGPDRVRLAEQITQRQILANFYTPEAYIGPGAGVQTVQGRPVSGHEAYQAALSHLAEFHHIVAEAGGDMIQAAREYELFKYVNRYAQAARSAGLGGPSLTYFDNLAAYLYRVNRQAHSVEAHTETGHAAIDHPAQRLEAARRGAGFLNDPTTAPVTDVFLQSTIERFMQLTRETLPLMRQVAETGRLPELGTEHAQTPVAQQTRRPPSATEASVIVAPDAARPTAEIQATNSAAVTRQVLDMLSAPPLTLESRTLDPTRRMRSSGYAGSGSGLRGVYQQRLVGMEQDAAIKVYPAGRRPDFERELAGAIAAARSRHGPRVHGLVDVGQGWLAFAMDVQEGHFRDIAVRRLTYEHRSAALPQARQARRAITERTIVDLQAFRSDLLLQGYYYRGELQYLIGPDGSLRPIDFQGIEPLPQDRRTREETTRGVPDPRAAAVEQHNRIFSEEEALLRRIVQSNQRTHERITRPARVYEPTPGDRRVLPPPPAQLTSRVRELLATPPSASDQRVIVDQNPQSNAIQGEPTTTGANGGGPPPGGGGSSGGIPPRSSRTLIAFPPPPSLPQYADRTSMGDARPASLASTSAHPANAPVGQPSARPFAGRIAPSTVSSSATGAPVANVPFGTVERPMQLRGELNSSNLLTEGGEGVLTRQFPSQAGAYLTHIEGVEEPVVVKVIPSFMAERFQRELTGALVAERTGFGPHVYGVVNAGASRLAVAMARQPGRTINDAREHVNQTTREQLQRYRDELLQQEVYCIDLQFFVDQVGAIRPYDFE